MLSNLNLLVARERTRDLLEAAAVERSVHPDETPATRVVLRQAVAADALRLRRLADLDSARPLRGAALVAEVDGRLRAALSLDGGSAIADPFFNGCELVDLLRLRATQLQGH